MNISPISGVNAVTPTDMDTTTVVNTDTKLNLQTNLAYPTDEAFMSTILTAFSRFGFNLSSILDNNFNNSSFGLANPLLKNSFISFVRSFQFVLNRIQEDHANTEALQEDVTDEINANTLYTEDASLANRQVGFANFINDLLFLIGNNDDANNNPGLQSSYNTLINLLLPNSPTVTQTPALNAFLTMMVFITQNQINNQNDIGTTIITEI